MSLIAIGVEYWFDIYFSFAVYYFVFCKMLCVHTQAKGSNTKKKIKLIKKNNVAFFPKKKKKIEKLPKSFFP